MGDCDSQPSGVCVDGGDFFIENQSDGKERTTRSVRKARMMKQNID